MSAISSWLAGWLPGYEPDGKSSNNDDVYPVHFIDHASILRTSIISYAFRFDQVLDANALHSALRGLLAIGEWKKLSGRLRSNSRGELEIHVPRILGPDRPAVRFSHVKLPLRISEHGLGKRLPRKTGMIPSVHEGCHGFRPFFHPDTLPDNIQHYLTTDEPLLCLHVTSFSDATLVSLNFPHVVSDAMGTADLLRSWSKVLAHRADLVAPLAGAREDVMSRVGGGSDAKARGGFILEDRLTRGLSLLVFAARYAWDLVTRRNVEARHIFLPAEFIAHLRRQAEDELGEGAEPGQAEPKIPFVSDGDLITAWAANMVIRSRSLTRPAIICNVFDLRSRLEHTFTPGKVYLQNLILPSTAILPAMDKSKVSVSQMALLVRRAIVTQTGDQQVRSLMRIARASFASWGMMPLFAAANSMVVPFSNWSKARFLDAVDFSPAVVSSAPVRDCSASPARRGRPVALWGTTQVVDRSARDAIIVYGKDASDDYWIHAYLRTETWALIEAKFKKYERAGSGGGRYWDAGSLSSASSETVC